MISAEGGWCEEDPGLAHDPRSRETDCCVCRELTSLPTLTGTRRQAEAQRGRGRQPARALWDRAPSYLQPEPPPASVPLWMGGKQSTAGRPRGAFPGVSSDDSAVPPSAHFVHYRPSGTMGLRSRSVSSVAGMGIDHSPAVPFGFYTPRGTDSDRAGGGSAGTTAPPHGTGYQDTGGGGHRTDGVLYLGSRGSLADTLPLHIAPRWFSSHSGKVCAQTHAPHLLKSTWGRGGGLRLFAHACCCFRANETADKHRGSLMTPLAQRLPGGGGGILTNRQLTCLHSGSAFDQHTCGQVHGGGCLC